ncbi:MAG TPA: ring-cleaving dioxygenase [Puia sp.]|nr:ring-cleaving dioxygenase [Puia sp.]
MIASIKGIHHITAIAGNARRNLDFYTRVLGLRMVKRTVNFDDPGTYHFYFGNESGAPGTIMTFFPWEGISAGRNGTGMATEIGYSVSRDSLYFWADRFREQGIVHGAVAERMGEAFLPFSDPDGLQISLIATADPDDRRPWAMSEIPAAAATKGFHSVTLTLRDVGPTAELLTGVFGYREERREGNRYRFRTDAVPTAAIVDLVETPGEGRGLNGGGTNHHVAFRVVDEEAQMAFREKILSRGLHITPKINRDYFFSVYFREPGGVLFELATENPGFTVDEPLAELGTELKLPLQYEPMRKEIEKSLPSLS